VELDVSDLAARGLALEWDGPGDRKRRFGLAPSRGVTGRYTIDPDAHRIDAATDEELVLSEVAWPLSEGEVTLTGEAPLARLAIDLEIGRGESGSTKGEVGLASAQIPSLTIQVPALGSAPLSITGLGLFEAALALDGSGGLAFVASHAEIDRISLRVAGRDIAIESLALEGVKLRRLNGVWILSVATATADDLRIESGETSLVATKLAARRIGFRAGELTIGDLEVADTSFEQPDLRRSAGDDAPKERPGRAGFDWGALDRLNGKIDLDLTAETTVPLIGHRRATHHFRLRVDHGAINYYRLEKSLSALEDALLDFEVKDRRLLLVADVPFMPLAKKTIVSWALPDAEEVALAERHLVRIRRLLDYRLKGSSSSSRTKNDDKKSFAVREIRFDGIDVALRWSGGDRVSLPSGGHLVWGSSNRPAIADLRVTGGVRHHETEAPTGRLDVEAGRLRMGVDGARIGERVLDIGRIGAREVRANVAFAGLAPAALTTAVAGLRLRDLSLRP
jgi:hypothetical protein